MGPVMTTEEQAQGCIFCAIAAHKVPAQIILEDSDALVFKDIAPEAPVHLLIVPRKHIARLSDSGAIDASLLGHLQCLAITAAAQCGVTSFRLVTNNGAEAHQTVDHLHYHLLGGRRMGWPPG